MSFKIQGEKNNFLSLYEYALDMFYVLDGQLASLFWFIKNSKTLISALFYEEIK